MMRLFFRLRDWVRGARDTTVFMSLPEQYEAVRNVYKNRSLGLTGCAEMTGSDTETALLGRIWREHGYRLMSLAGCLTASLPHTCVGSGSQERAWHMRENAMKQRGMCELIEYLRRCDQETQHRHRQKELERQLQKAEQAAPDPYASS